MEKVLWELFKKTGDYRYYMLLKELENVYDGNCESKGNNNQ